MGIYWSHTYIRGKRCTANCKEKLKVMFPELLVWWNPPQNLSRAYKQQLDPPLFAMPCTRQVVFDVFHVEENINTVAPLHKLAMEHWGIHEGPEPFASRRCNFDFTNFFQTWSIILFILFVSSCRNLDSIFNVYRFFAIFTLVMSSHHLSSLFMSPVVTGLAVETSSSA